MNNLTKILFIIGLALAIAACCWSCDGKCDKRPDLVVPEFINGQVQVATDYRFTVVGLINYPFGTQVFLTNTVNEFYSVVRTNPFNGSPIVFYWNINSPPPFYPGANPPNNLLQPGEEVLVHRCVVNQALPDFDCLVKEAPSSRTEMKVVVKVQNGQIVDEQKQTTDTPPIPAGQYRVVSFPVVVNQFGSYEMRFTANADNSVAERDTSNNIYIERPTPTLGGG